MVVAVRVRRCDKAPGRSRNRPSWTVGRSAPWRLRSAECVQPGVLSGVSAGPRSLQIVIWVVAFGVFLWLPWLVTVWRNRGRYPGDDVSH